MRPLLQYTFSLAEKLHKTQREILKMDAEEFYNWMSYDMLKDEKFNKKIQKLRSQDMDNEQRSAAIKAMFESLGRKE